MQIPSHITHIINMLLTNTFKNGMQISQKAILALNKSWTWRLRTVGDAIPLTQHMHFHTKFQQHNLAHKATLASLSHHKQFNKRNQPPT